MYHIGYIFFCVFRFLEQPIFKHQKSNLRNLAHSSTFKDKSDIILCCSCCQAMGLVLPRSSAPRKHFKAELIVWVDSKWKRCLRSLSLYHWGCWQEEIHMPAVSIYFTFFFCFCINDWHTHIKLAPCIQKLF